MPARIKKCGVAATTLMLVGMLTGCTSGPAGKPELRLVESPLEVRSLQSRKLAAPSESTILAATVAVLQDMEFNIDRIEKPLGMISASKVSDADDKGEQTGLFMLDLLCALGSGSDCGYMSSAMDEQHLMLTMVVLPSLERSGEYVVRVTLQRIIYDKEDRVKVQERIASAEVYQEIFTNLRQALLIEVNTS